MEEKKLAEITGLSLLLQTLSHIILLENPSTLVLLDLSKAFDSIDHISLLKKLRAMDTSKEAIEWFRSYLTGRK